MWAQLSFNVFQDVVLTGPHTEICFGFRFVCNPVFMGDQYMLWIWY